MTVLFIAIIEKKTKAPLSNSIISNTPVSSGTSANRPTESSIPEVSTQRAVCDRDHIAAISVPGSLGVELVSKVMDKYDIFLPRLITCLLLSQIWLLIS